MIEVHLSFVQDLLASGRARHSSGAKRHAPEDSDDCGSTDEKDVDEGITITNPPILTSLYTDPDTQEKYVSIMAALPGGITDVEFSLVGTDAGTTLARIEFSWPTHMHDLTPGTLQEGFLIAEPTSEKSKTTSEEYAEISVATVDNSVAPKDMAKLISFQDVLKSKRNSIDKAPKGTNDIVLPASVQTSIESYTLQVKKAKDGSLLLFADLMAYQGSNTVPRTKKRVTFLQMYSTVF